MIRESIQRELHWFYPWLKSRAGQLLALERKGHTLQPTALANEVVSKLMRWNGSLGDKPEESLARISQRIMQRTLVDSGRKHQIRQNHLSTAKVAATGEARAESGRLESVKQALDDLRKADATLARFVELKCMQDYTLKEAAEAVNWSERTAARRWNFAKAWLAKAAAQ